MKICIILGTRPEIIKMEPIIKYCEKQKIDFFIIHTGQHYSYEMDKIFFKELKIPSPKYNLEVGSGTHGKQTGKMLEKIEETLIQEKPDIVLVEGDTNSVLAGALSAKKLNIKVGHIEAGLRSYDERMPEEFNRKLTDHISDFLFAPTKKAKENLIREGIDEKKIFVTGNTIVDIVSKYIKKSEKKENFILITLHRQENVDNKEILEKILKGLELIRKESKLKIIYPIHPRTKKRIKEFGLYIPKGIKTINPVGYFDFLELQSNASLVLTDSGGIQEESCILKVPCVTIRRTTERPETVEVGANITSGEEPEKIFESYKKMINKEKNWENPFGDGKSGERIVNIILNKLKPS
jgi:UDP-N-acetylglucosamine 2-epimerase (non-hydrolysing)